MSTEFEYIDLSGLADRPIPRGAPFVLDARTLAMTRAGNVLALKADLFGAMMTLPARVSDTGTTETAAAGVIAIVAIDGPLAQRGEAHMCGVLDGYDWVTQRVTDALATEGVSGVVLRINSPGGDVAGLEESVKRMRGAADRASKPVIAYVDELAASAAYWIASGVADEIIVPAMGEVGSIGTIGAWVDSTKAFEQAGHKIHIVRSPAGKAAAHPAAPVEEVANERLAALVGESTDRFVAAVSQRRGIASDAIVDLDGALVRGQNAVTIGLANSVGSLEDAIARAASLASPTSTSSRPSAERIGANTGTWSEADMNAAIAALDRELAKRDACGTAVSPQPLSTTLSADELAHCAAKGIDPEYWARSKQRAESNPRRRRRAQERNNTQ